MKFGRRGFLKGGLSIAFGTLGYIYGFRLQLPGALDEPKPPTIEPRTVVWTGSTGDWADPDNWVGGKPPGPGDTAIITSGCIRKGPDGGEIETLMVYGGSVGIGHNKQMLVTKGNG